MATLTVEKELPKIPRLYLASITTNNAYICMLYQPFLFICPPALLSFCVSSCGGGGVCKGDGGVGGGACVVEEVVNGGGAKAAALEPEAMVLAGEGDLLEWDGRVPVIPPVRMI